ncbi:MAG: SDR family NAD(P)-dependent oxidoreductase, partial [Bacteroidales bacterium]|nr:SDR family NAD(P)-dependent oxidoreductase [Bacteroidales bacterium]
MREAYKDKVVVITGGANGIGRCIANEFRAEGAQVFVIDKGEGEHFVGDIANKEVLEAFASHILSHHASV